MPLGERLGDGWALLPVVVDDDGGEGSGGRLRNNSKALLITRPLPAALPAVDERGGGDGA